MKISYKFISSNIFRTNLCIRNIISYAGDTQLCKQTGKRIHVCFHKDIFILTNKADKDFFYCLNKHLHQFPPYHTKIK